MAWYSDIGGAPIITTANSGDLCGSFQVERGLGAGYIPRDYSKSPHGSLAFAAPFKQPLIPRSEWDRRIQQIEAEGASLDLLAQKAGVETVSQGSTNFCWGFAAIRAIEIQRACQGEPTIALSPASVCAPITRYRNEGGWSTDAIEHIATDGVATAEQWPITAIDRQYDTEEVRTSRQAFKVRQWIDIKRRSFDELMTVLLMGYPVAVGYLWWGHAVCAVRPVKTKYGYGTMIWNSWGKEFGDGGFAVLTGDRAVADDAVAPTVVMPGPDHSRTRTM